MKVLVVEDDFASRELLKITLENEKYQCKVADNGEAGLELFNKFLPNVVISDVRMPKMDGMELLATIRKRVKDVIIIMITGHGNEQLAIQALQLGANNYIKKPLDLSDLKILLRRYYNVVQCKTLEKDIPDFILERVFNLEIDTEIKDVSSVVQFLLHKTGNTFENHDTVRLEVGLTELLTNSIEHGNLGITSEEKKIALQDNTLQDLYAQRLANDVYARKKVKISCDYNKDYCQWVIEDEGEGFDWRSIPNPTQGNFVDQLSGRGIFLSRIQFDELEFVGKGNVVIAKKYLT